MLLWLIGTARSSGPGSTHGREGGSTNQRKRLSPRSQGAPRRGKAQKSSNWEILKMHSRNDEAAVASYRRNRQDPPVLGQLLVTYFLLPPLSGTQRLAREQTSFECRQYDHIYAHIHEQPLLIQTRALLLLMSLRRYIHCVSRREQCRH